MDNIGSENIKVNLSNVFKEYGNAELPVELKEEVFDTLERLELAAKIVDLFTVKFLQAESDIINEIIDKDIPE